MRKIIKKVFFGILLILLAIIIKKNILDILEYRRFYSTKSNSTEINALLKLEVSKCSLTQKNTIDSNIFGINILDFSNESVSLIKDLHVKWVRIPLNRRVIERSKGTYDWSGYDIFISEMQKSNVKVLAILNDSPDWISNWNDEYDDYDKFAQEAVRRYAPYGVHYWEIFNEPNLPCCGWINTNVKPEDFTGNYALMLARSNREIHQIDKEAVISMGGLSTDGMAPQAFLEKMYSYGLKNCFDIFSYHPYGKAGQFKETAEEYRKIMSKYGDENKPIWFNELGTTDEPQNIILQKAFDERREVQAVFWFSLVDLDKIKDLYGLVDYGSYTKKPVYDIFKKHISEESP